MSETAVAVWDKLGQEAVGEIIEWTKGAKEFVSEQAPELVREVMAWGFWSNFCLACLFMCLTCFFTLLFFVGKNGLRRTKDDPSSSTFNRRDSWWIVTISSFIVTIPFFSLLFFRIYMCVYVSVAPRMYLLGYLKGLTK